MLAFGGEAWPQSAADLLEKARYVEETQGDLAGAIKMYQQISERADAERATAAEALFRLGSCYLKGGQETEATSTFEKLKKQYSEQKTLLARIPPLPAASLKLNPAPWGDDETMLMQVKTADGKERTVVAYQVESAQIGGRPVWHFQNSQPQMFMSVHADLETLHPIDSTFQFDSVDMRSQTTYSPDRVTTVRWDKTGEKKQELTNQRGIYDNEEVIHLIRRLPLAESYSVTIPVLAIGSPIVIDARIKVTGREKVTVPAGTFETHKVLVTVNMDGKTIKEDRFWYSADVHQYLVKVETNPVTMELSEVLTHTRASAASLKDNDMGVSLSAPAGWLLATIRSLREDLRVAVLAPDARVAGELTCHPLTKQNLGKTAAELADGHVEWGAKTLTSFVVRPGAREDFVLNGVPASRLVAEYTHPIDGRGMVEYRTFVVDKSNRLDLAFDVRKEQWDSVKPSIDEVVNSLRLR
jgi:hypothetical protein